jgi:putative oxidoreductase
MNTENRYFDAGLLILRAGLGLSYIFIHGMPKITGGPEEWANIGKAMSNLGIGIFPVFWGFMAAISEFLGGIFMLLGFVFRPALLMIGITMIVAFSQGLANGQTFARSVYPLELFVVLMGMAFTGPGRISIDNYIFGKKIFLYERTDV